MLPRRLWHVQSGRHLPGNGGGQGRHLGMGFVQPRNTGQVLRWGGCGNVTGVSGQAQVGRAVVHATTSCGGVVGAWGRPRRVRWWGRAPAPAGSGEGAVKQTQPVIRCLACRWWSGGPGRRMARPCVVQTSGKQHAPVGPAPVHPRVVAPQNKVRFTCHHASWPTPRRRMVIQVVAAKSPVVVGGGGNGVLGRSRRGARWRNTPGGGGGISHRPSPYTTVTQTGITARRGGGGNGSARENTAHRNGEFNTPQVWDVPGGGVRLRRFVSMAQPPWGPVGMLSSHVWGVTDQVNGPVHNG